MKNKKRFSLSTQINLIFTLITFVTSVLFILIFKQTIYSHTLEQSERHFSQYNSVVVKSTIEDVRPANSEYYEYVVFDITNRNIRRISNLSLEDEFITFRNLYINNDPKVVEESKNIFRYNNNRYIVNELTVDSRELIAITYSNNQYEKDLSEPVSGIIMVGFIAIIILGNAIILLWSSVTVERIKQLEVEVKELGSKSYRRPIKVEGNDEITELASTIDKMRDEILKNDEVKQEMLQNLSHDIKTPIAVIKSYGEAIKDGMAELEDIDIIINQTNILSEKVKKLLEWNRIEYIDDKQEFYPVDMADIINTVANNFKFKRDIKFELDLDNSYYVGLEDHFYTLVSNIVENALRYAKTVIKITLKNKKLTIYNDGEPIHRKFIDAEFKPYEKGHKGEFGLGLTIVQKIITNFNLKLSIKNEDDGVKFIIEPL